MNTQGKYMFVITKNATKPAIRTAIEKLYKVNITGVHVITGKSKQRQIGMRRGIKPAIRKAIVTLRTGQTIDTNTNS